MSRAFTLVTTIATGVLYLAWRRRRRADGSAAGARSRIEEFSDADARWLRRHQHRKVLDERVRVTGVAARDADGNPSVLQCYPLRMTGPSSKQPTERRDKRGGSANKWKADKPVPWPNTYWLVDPDLCSRIGRLEHLGWIQTLQARVHSGEEPQLVAALAAAHRAYARDRWSLLSAEDREYAANGGYEGVLRDYGVSGFRQDTQVKCLHTHTAHALATGGNPIGRLALEALERGEDGRAVGRKGCAVRGPVTISEQ